MLRRSVINRKAGDFVLTLPNENVYRSIFTLASPPQPHQQGTHETETLARDIVARTKYFATDAQQTLSNCNVGKFTSSHSSALVMSNTLFSSPLFQLSGVPTSVEEPDTLFAWSPVVASTAKQQESIVAWSGVDNTSASSSSPKKIIVVVPAENGDVHFYEATPVNNSNSHSSSTTNGRIRVKLNKKIETSSSASKTPTEDDVAGASMASSLVQAQLRLDHASWSWSQIRAICNSCALLGTQCKFQSNRMSESTFFNERVGAIGSSEHSLFAAIQHTAMTLAESLTVATPLMLNKTEESKAEAIARDIEYDSGLLYLYSRNLLRNAHQSAYQLFLRHGPFDEKLTSSFRGNEEWLAAGQNCDMTPIAALMERLGSLALLDGNTNSHSSGSSSNSSNKSNKKSASASSSVNPVKETINALFKSKEPESFSDVHMNLTSSTASIISDFQSLKKKAASASGGSNNNSGTTATTLSSSRKQLLPVIASELMGTTAMAYYTSNALEIGEGLGDQMQTGDFPGFEMFACNFSSPVECSAVAWLALEVAAGSSKLRRGEMLREMDALKNADSVKSGENTVTHPMNLPRAPEQKQQEEEAEE